MYKIWQFRAKPETGQISPGKFFPAKVMADHFDHFVLSLQASKTIGSECYWSKLRKIRQIKENETN